ncbi:hypothetical protein J2X69_004009 [Algoriphagus sp. 4150]|uniref:hypothetical protein n=1 Tax=Algoriphagus sp. 4150 TaxID=2817756 RepID=UPI0028551FF4|nr:hypothetical protein [Algoriphagus sp. 4150]MDR7131645.1 hypothetical protein [Algoriphagus sp. 4150]
MKIKILGFALILMLFSCGGGNDEDYSPNNRCYHNGKSLHLGPQGGCYYINSNGNKTYVDRSECRC